MVSLHWRSVGYLRQVCVLENSGLVNPLNIVSVYSGYYKNSYVYDGGMQDILIGASSTPSSSDVPTIEEISILLLPPTTSIDFVLQHESVAYTGGIADTAVPTSH
jgi:hypothetical protein